MGENNRIIAEFMGWSIHPKHGDKYLINKSKSRVNLPWYLERHSEAALSDFRYDWDWNLLIPVIEKIRNNPFVTNVNYNIGGDFIIEGLTSTKVLNIIINKEDFKSDLEMCYFGVIEFIKWYNQNSEKEN